MSPRETRLLLITADDFGVGPETSRGILDLAARGALTSTVMLVTSPFAEEGIAQWRRSGSHLEIGWHPCLTLDSPILPPDRVPTLVDERGRFRPLGAFLKNLIRGRLLRTEIESEFRAQLARFVDLVGHPPRNVNAHHHVHIFGPVGDALRSVLADVLPRPHVRRVVEPWGTLAHIRGARLKRYALGLFGRRAGRRQTAAGFCATEWVLGVTDPPHVRDPEFFRRWLKRAPGKVLELTCHPGHLDAALDGRDGSLTDGQLHRRVREFELLSDPGFLDAVREAGFTLATAADLCGQPATGTRNAG